MNNEWPQQTGDAIAVDIEDVQMKQEESDQANIRKKPHIEIYADAFMLIGEHEEVKVIWSEGKQSKEAQVRYESIRKAFSDGFLKKKIEEAKSPEITTTVLSTLSTSHKEHLEKIVASLSAQEGRALVDILVLQLATKAICPEQDIRLHKGNKGSDDAARNRKSNKITTTSRLRFSWMEGISMRNLDRVFIVPTLREYDLLRMNPDGAFMTRSFSENYPYTLFYKAEIIGAKRRWLEVIDALEEGSLHAETALLYVLDLLWKTSERFKALVAEILESLERWLLKRQGCSIEEVVNIITRHIDGSPAPARLLEIAIHSLLQALEEMDIDLRGMLKPLLPMRNANQKHGNLADVEVTLNTAIVEAWDAKYGVMYLGDDINALEDKFVGHNVAELRFGYILHPQKWVHPEIDHKIRLLEEEFGVEIGIFLFEEWAHEQMLRAKSEGVVEEKVAIAWIHAYVESLALLRPEKAPIDEPTYSWLQSLQIILTP